jgi:hypothetical protein
LIDGGEGSGNWWSGGGCGPGGDADLEEEVSGVCMGPALGVEVGILLVELGRRAVEILGDGLVRFV